MKIISYELIDKLRSKEFPFDVDFTDSYKANVDTFPRVVVTQLDNPTILRDADGEILSGLFLQLDIYTKDAVHPETQEVLSRGRVATYLASEIDDVMYKLYKLNRDHFDFDSRYTTDVGRAILRYSGVIDKFDYTYRAV